MPRLKKMNPGCCCGGTAPDPNPVVPIPNCFCTKARRDLRLDNFPPPNGCDPLVTSYYRSADLTYFDGTTVPGAGYDPNATGQAWLSKIFTYHYPGIPSNPDFPPGDYPGYYRLACAFNRFDLGFFSTFGGQGGQYTGRSIWSWVVGGTGNACDPFALCTGFNRASPGSDYEVCGGSVKINCGTPPGDSYADNTATPVAMSMPAFAAGAGLPPAPALRVGLVTAHLLLGGAEEWQLTLADSLSVLLGPTISFVGAANLGQSDPAMRAELAALMPVADGIEAARDLASRCDLIVTWAVIDLAALYAGLPVPPRTLFACHLPSAWGAATEAMLAPADRFVAVSRFALDPIPAALKPRAAVVWNAIAAPRLATAQTRAQIRASWGIN